MLGLPELSSSPLPQNSCVDTQQLQYSGEAPERAQWEPSSLLPKRSPQQLPGTHHLHDPITASTAAGVSAAVLSNPEIKDKRKQKKNQRLKTQTSGYFLFSFTSNFCLALQKKKKKKRQVGVLTAQQQHRADPRNAGEAQQRPWTSTKMSRVGAQQPPILSKPLSTL